MAFKDIKGIVVEIGGDTSGLQNALKKVNSATSSLSKELRGINSMLKLDPKNTDLLAQKQTVLKNNIKETTKYLDGLKQAQSEYISSGGDLNSSKYRSLQREIILTENKLKQLKIEASNWTKVSKSLSELSSKMKAIGDKATQIGQTLTRTVTLPLVGIGTIGIKTAKQLESSMQQVEKIYGDASNQVKDFAENSAIAYNMSTADAYKYSQVYGNLIQSITDDQTENANNTINLLKASSVIASATGRTMEDVMDRIRSGLLGNTEAIEDLGVNVNVSLLESTDAFKKFAGDKSWNQLDFQTQQQIRLFGILEQTTKKYGNEINQNTTTNVQELNAKFQNLVSTIGEKLLPYFNRIVDKLTELADRFNSLSPTTQDLIIKIGMIAAAIGPALIVIGKIISTVGILTDGLSWLAAKIAVASGGAGGLSGVLTALTGPIGIIIAAVAALTAAFVYLYNTNESFRNSMNEIWGGIVNTFNEYVKPAFQDLMAGVKELWENVIKPFGEFLWSFWSPMLISTFTKIGGVLGVLFTQWGKIIGNIMNALRGLIDFIVGVFSGDWERAWKGIVQMVSNIFGAVVNYVKIPINTIISLLNGAIQGINQIKIPDWVPGVGGKGINIPLIPKLAKGGIVDSATLAMIGEGKSAEAVIPLDRTLAKYMAEALKIAGGNKNIVMNFYPQQMTESELERAFNYVDRRLGVLY